MTSLPDVNVLLALVWANHLHHAAAHDWFRANASSGWATCVLTQSGFLRLSLNPRIVGVTLTATDAIKLLHGLVQHPQHQFVESLPTLTSPAFSHLSKRLQGYRQTSDFVLLHVAQHHGLRLATFDKPLANVTPNAALVELLVT
ncbi:MAG: TA system VapC family ribonuclease toxin [Planctomycetota bacterium]